MDRGEIDSALPVQSGRGYDGAARGKRPPFRAVGLERVQEPSGGDEDELEVLEGEVVEQNEEAVTEAEDGAETGNSEE